MVFRGPGMRTCFSSWCKTWVRAEAVARYVLPVALVVLAATSGSVKASGYASSIPALPGWNLLPAPLDPDGSILRSWKRLGLRVWPAESFELPASSGNVEASQEAAVLDGVRGVWVWVPEGVGVEVWIVAPWSGRLPFVSDGWRFLVGSEDGEFTDSSIDRLYAWDGPSQRYVRAALDEPLKFGQGYWGHGQEASNLEDVFGVGAALDVGAFDREDTARANYERAEDARKTLLRTTTDPHTGQTWAYQVEYEPRAPKDFDGDLPGQRQQGQEGAVDGSAAKGFGDKAREPYETSQEGDAWTDSKYLAGFERVWVYTQGIALAQLARRSDEASHELAWGMARYLCARAVKGRSLGEDIIRGWPFSWNTKNDSWEDARLVTGANAWAIHGLGAFLVSEAFQSQEESEQAPVRLCYKQALQGLQDHRRRLWVSTTGQTVSLMTAGWTVIGLQYAASPSTMPAVFLVDGTAFEEESEVRWPYYSVLDALGYQRINEEQPAEIERWVAKPGEQPRAEDALVLTAEIHAALKSRVLAENVVTEHNLDVLSVLNQALKHPRKTGVEDVAALRVFRDELREGIFSLLWDGEGWRRDLLHTLQNDGVDGPRRVRIEKALDENALGRFVTGGILDPLAPNGFDASAHVAIDNCSWLSLSVDYDELPPDSVHVGRLAKCLAYTELHFAKKLKVGSKTYYGTHYFQNGFHDSYIDPSALQESSFHLEATTGLIMGLRRFAKAYPEHPRTPSFRAHADALWDGVQAFVGDHGFLYSSQRIQNLSTRLSSSTAVIWFVDVYEDVDSHGGRIVQAGARPVFLRGKSSTKALQTSIKLIDEVLNLPAPIVASALSSVVAVGHLTSLGAEIDPGLETIFVGDGPPSARHWERVGFVVAEDVLAQPLRTFIRDEAVIRDEVPVYVQDPNVFGGRMEVVSFDDAGLYYFEVDRIGLDESPLGSVRVLLPQDGATWPVYRLKTDRHREELLKAFVDAHPRMAKARLQARWIPQPLQTPWLGLVELTVKSDFSLSSIARDDLLEGPRALEAIGPFRDHAGILNISWEGSAPDSVYVRASVASTAAVTVGQAQMEDAVVECSYDKEKLPALPYEGNDSLFRRELRPFEPHRVKVKDFSALDKAGVHLPEGMKKIMNELASWQVIIPLFGNDFGPDDVRDKDLLCRLWIREKNGIWNEPADFTIRPWRDWTPRITLSRDHAVVEIPVGKHQSEDVVSSHVALPDNVEIMAHGVIVRDCTSEEKQEIVLRRAYNNFTSWFGLKPKAYLKIEKDDHGKPVFKKGHTYCIESQIYVRGGGPELPWRILTPEKVISIPDS